MCIFASTMQPRLLIMAVAVLLGGIGLRAQNNPYKIDDSCYECMTRADALIGKEGFDEANEALLKAATAASDNKALVLYYFERLRNCCALRPVSDANVLAAQEEVKTNARKYGYLQYYYQSYQSVKNYFFNTGRQIRALELIQEMQKQAFEENNEYGKWLAEKELASYYKVYGANSAAREHIRASIRTYLSTDDPTVRRQSLCPYYLDYASTFQLHLDSARFFVDKAWENAVLPADTVMCMRESAILAAVAGDYPRYKSFRDKCLESPHKQALGRQTPTIFKSIDALYDGSFDKTDRSDTSVYYSLVPNNIYILSAVAETVGRLDVAVDMKDFCLNANQKDFSTILEMHVSEMDARYENDRLQDQVEEKTRQVEKVRRIVMVLGILLLLGVILGLLSYVRNLRRTQKKDEKMIAELTAANERVMKADAAKDRFIQNMTHELRTPLNAITGFSQLLALPDGMFSSEEKEEFGKHVLNNTSMMTMLLDDLMSTSAMDSGGYRITMGEAECESICKEAINAAEHRLQPGVQLLFKPSMELPFTFTSDALRIQQVLTNLLTNACKHTKEGEIRLGCSLEEVPGMISFSVEDTGPGIPEGEAQRIFERFVKLDDFVQGTGLGLSICREIAAKMNGKIYLDTSYGPGARFVFAVPV